MGSHSGLAVVEGLLLVVETLRAVLEVVFGERGPGSVVTPLGSPRSGTGEEERVGYVTHSSTEGMPPEVFPSLTVRERDQEKEIISHETRQTNQCRLYNVSVDLEDIQEAMIS